MRSLCHLSFSSNYVFLLITEVLLSDYTPEDPFAIPGFQSFRKIRFTHYEGSYLVYTCDSIRASLCKDPQLNETQDIT